MTLLERFTGLPAHSPVLVGSSVYAYDHPAGWLTGITHRNSSEATLTAYGYTFEANGRISSQALTQGGNTATRNYAYDEGDQLTGVTSGTAQTLEDYAYDASGNRTGSHLASSYQTDLHNRLIDDGAHTYTYDGEGNVLSRTRKSDGQFTQYSWDHRNRLVGVVTKATSAGAELERVEYLYDHADRRVARLHDADGAGSAAATYAHYLFDDRGNVVLELADADGAGSNPADVKHRYLHGPAVDQLLSDEADSGGGRRSAGP
ncbi:MAG: hypothetical protein KF708_24865 [Pirellulales bacterium]|nr:hypothetical protein [Pirellulales bacterium]